MSRTSENLPARRHKKKRKNAPSLRLTVLITTLVFVVIAAGALMVPGLNVTEVYCEGNANLKPEEITAVSQIKTGTNILLVNIGKAEREIKKLPFINRVEVKRVLPDKICIRIDERVPAAYLRAGTEGAVVGTEGVILKKLDSAEISAVAAQNKPVPAKGEEDKKEDKQKKEKDGQAEADTEPTEDGQAEDEMVQTEQTQIVYNIPFIEGIELKNADEGKDARCDDKERLRVVLEICKALDKAQLLSRATYLDVSDLLNIRLIIENRLDVQLGTHDNIEYRAKFLSEVVNTGISAYEKAIVDYRGDDIYVRAPEDGKARTIPKPKDDEETDGEDSENSDEETDEDDAENSDEETDGEDSESSDDGTDSESGEESDRDSDAEAESNGTRIGEL